MRYTILVIQIIDFIFHFNGLIEQKQEHSATFLIYFSITVHAQCCANKIVQDICEFDHISIEKFHQNSKTSKFELNL